MSPFGYPPHLGESQTAPEVSGFQLSLFCEFQEIHQSGEPLRIQTGSGLPRARLSLFWVSLSLFYRGVIIHPTGDVLAGFLRPRAIAPTPEASGSKKRRLVQKAHCLEVKEDL